MILRIPKKRGTGALEKSTQWDQAFLPPGVGLQCSSVSDSRPFKATLPTNTWSSVFEQHAKALYFLSLLRLPELRLPAWKTLITKGIPNTMLQVAQLGLLIVRLNQTFKDTQDGWFFPGWLEVLGPSNEVVKDLCVGGHDSATCGPEKKLKILYFSSLSKHNE